MVKDINQSGISGSAPQPVAAVGRILFFFAADGAKGAELWRTDGTEAGTYLVKDIRPGSAGQFPPFSGVELNGRLLFAADDGVHGKELWISDGTEAGTQTLVDLTPVGGSSISNLTVSGGRAFFTASTPSYGTELWMTDGTAAGTRLVKDILSGTASSWPAQLRDADGRLCFSAAGDGGREPWVSDGTLAGIHRIADVEPGQWGSNPGTFTPVHGVVYFVASTLAKSIELWKTDDTGTAIVSDIEPYGSSSPASLTAFGDDLLFLASKSPIGRQLWVSDGTAGGTYPLTNLPGSGVPATPIAALGGAAVFYAGDTTNGSELWRTDGTPGGTYLLKDINPGTASSAVGSSVVFASDGQHAFFAASDGVHGQELWTTDGTVEGTFMVSDVREGSSGSFPSASMVAGGALYFSADDGVHGRELWTLGRDTTPPVIVFSGNQGSYAVDEFVAITCTATDADSQIASMSCPTIAAAAYEFPLGVNTFTATAVDEAGNAAQASVTFSVTADYRSLAALVTRFAGDGGVARALNAKLAAAAAAGARGNAQARRGTFGAFANQVAAQTGKVLTADDAAILLRLVDALR